MRGWRDDPRGEPDSPPDDSAPEGSPRPGARGFLGVAFSVLLVVTGVALTALGVALILEVGVPVLGSFPFAGSAPVIAGPVLWVWAWHRLRRQVGAS